MAKLHASPVAWSKLAPLPIGGPTAIPEARKSGAERRSRVGSSTKGKQLNMATETAGIPAPASGHEHLTLEDRIWLLRAMLLMRGIEERAMSLYRQGKVPGSFYDGFGQEAVSAGAAFAMAPQDRLCILHRDLAAHVIRGVTPVCGSCRSTWAGPAGITPRARR